MNVYSKDMHDLQYMMSYAMSRKPVTGTGFFKQLLYKSLTLIKKNYIIHKIIE